MKIEISHVNDNKLPFKLQVKRFACLVVFSLAFYQLFVSIKGVFFS